ncbi:MAG: trypsin-like peptidase domain-containing protein [Clostridia bacterium]|nr:trypsin-like peptidase domain-containing protein [Clostridia bacterium]
MKNVFKILVFTILIVFYATASSACTIYFDGDGSSAYPPIITTYSKTPYETPNLPQKTVGFSFGNNNESKTFELTEMLDIVRPSVLELYAYKKSGNKEPQNAGSGIFIGYNGEISNRVYYVLTCKHVISGTEKYVVKDIFGNEFTASLVGADGNSDVAVLKVDPVGDGYSLTDRNSDKFVNITIANYRTCKNGDMPLKVGESVYAIGNPLGTLGGTVTQGIISSTDREVPVDGREMTLIQTDCAINPGNSGGGLFDRYGNLVGMVNAGYAGEIEGLNFAISSDTAYKYASDFIEFGYVKGLGNVVAVDGEKLSRYEDLAVVNHYEIKKNFTVISAVNEYFYSHGLRVNDIIVSVEYKGEKYLLGTELIEQDGEYINPSVAFINYLSELECFVDDEMKFTVVHNGENKETEITVKLKQCIY